MNALKWLWGYVKRYRTKLTFAGIFTPMYVLGIFALPVIIGLVVDEITNGGEMTKLVMYLGVLVLAEVIKTLVFYGRSLLCEDISQGVIKDVRNNIYKKLQTLDCTYYDRTQKGDIMSRLTMDADAIRIVISQTFPTLMDYFISIIIGFVIIARSGSSGVYLALSLFSVGPFIGFFAYKLAKTIKKDFVAMRESNAELNTVVAENISGNRVVKAYAREEYEQEKFDKKNEEYKNSFMRHVYTWVRYYPLMHLFVIMVYVIFIVFGGVLLIQGKITVAQFTVVNGSLWCITAPMASLGGLINQYQQFGASTAKIRALEEEEPLIANRDVKKRDTGIVGKIQFKNVSFAYGSDRVLRDLNFTVEPGQTLAIVGPTGSGKSTIINLISRFYDATQGAVYIDDVNIRNIDLKTVRGNIASAMQDVFLFSDTIKNNIAYGAPNATYEDVERVARIADAHGFISKLSDGYDTMVGERGTGLSGGQRQRISLARALLKNPSILILDDTTSALDMETEFGIQENLKGTLRTKIIIAHRISSVRNADLILVLNHGNIVEWGNHEKLMSLNGYYKGIFDHQFGDFNRMPSQVIEHPAQISLFGERGEQYGS
ncbi:MAG: ABC transporter ATP-binding protein [Oscillospiraceae bacterium]|nr:ABC transporter ATP-binding protein [Oscillospiraceae bacterium]